MLTVTDDAKALVQAATAESGEEAVLRLAPDAEGELHLALAERAEEGDRVVADSDGRLAVDAQTAVLVEDAVLDAVDVDDETAFVLSAPGE